MPMGSLAPASLPFDRLPLTLESELRNQSPSGVIGRVGIWKNIDLNKGNSSSDTEFRTSSEGVTNKHKERMSEAGQHSMNAEGSSGAGEDFASRS